ncbi:MAG: ABC transporter permease subunit [Desulfovibrio sp.]|nr:ABC transporter permease subunit [Desulfovibrio sp.]
MQAPSAQISLPGPAESSLNTGVPEPLPRTTKKLSATKRLFLISPVRKALLLAALAIFWQVYAEMLNNELVLPTFTSTVTAFLRSCLDGELTNNIFNSLKILCVAYSMGIVFAGLLTTLAVTTRIGTDLLELCTGMFNLLPAIALLPLALLWFGLGYASIIFVMVHSVIWPLSLNIYAGFTGVSPTLRMVGRGYGLSGPGFIFKILVPAAFPHILTGLKIGWAFSWRTLIAAELVFGTSSGGGGIGWFIFEKKNQLEIAELFSGLMAIIIIGVLVENFFFKTLENRTIQKWGMKL